MKLRARKVLEYHEINIRREFWSDGYGIARCGEQWWLHARSLSTDQCFNRIDDWNFQDGMNVFRKTFPQGRLNSRPDQRLTRDPIFLISARLCHASHLAFHDSRIVEIRSLWEQQTAAKPKEAQCKDANESMRTGQLSRLLRAIQLLGCETTMKWRCGFRRRQVENLSLKFGRSS